MTLLNPAPRLACSTPIYLHRLTIAYIKFQALVIEVCGYWLFAIRFIT